MQTEWEWSRVEVGVMNENTDAVACVLPALAVSAAFPILVPRIQMIDLIPIELLVGKLSNQDWISKLNAADDADADYVDAR